jgi:glycosyltransferase involved in cell wall biosynthesis
MMDPLVSILVPSYNYARYLPECLDSILSQRTDAAFEVVVVNDASTDHTRDVLQRYDDARVRVLHNATNQGHARTIGIAIEAAHGSLVARIDPDDRYKPDFLARTVPIFDQHPRVGLVYGDAVMIDSEGTMTGSCEQRHQGRPFRGNELADLLEKNFICAPTAIARRECWLAALPVPAHLAFNDWYFTVMIAREWDFFYIPEVLAEYRVHATQHHTRVAHDGSEERSVRWLLDQVYEHPERNPELERAKQSRRARAYARHSVDAGEKYFGFGRYADARRCYLDALRRHPAVVLQQPVLRHLAGTLLGARVYEALKRRFRRNGRGTE